MQNCPRQLAMQSCVLCSFVRCGTSNQIEKKKKKNIVVRNTPMLFQPTDATLADGARTNNICESWNTSFNGLVEYKNATIWACIEGLKKYYCQGKKQ